MKASEIFMKGRMKMNLRSGIITTSIGSLLFIGGCEHTLSPVTSGEIRENEPLVQNAIGEKLENPYTVESMIRARDSLVAQGHLAKSKLKDEDFLPTHYYIRFKPETIEEYKEINQKSDLVLWDFPLDYKFPDGMTNYRDPEVPSGKPNYLYTAVNVNQKLPSQNYEILAKLILEPESGENVLAKRAEIFNCYDLLESEALRITGNIPETQTGLAKATGTWRPTGNIQVTDDVLNRNVPVVSVNVRTRNWFKWWDGYTDGNGNFRCPKEYYGDISYSLRWQYPENKFDIRTGDYGQAYFNGPSQKRGAWNLVIASGMSWVHAHIFRGGRFYIAEEPWNLGAPFQNVSIGAYDEDGRAYYAGSSRLKTDIRVYRVNNGERNSALRLFNSTCHELAHEHHYQIRGRADWSKIDLKIIEGWAVAVGQFLTDRVYNNRDFWQRRSFAWMREENVYSPVVIDLIDAFNQRSSGSMVIALDNVSGYTLEQIQNSLKDVQALSEWSQKLKAIPNPTSRFFDEYFSQIINFQPAPTPAGTSLAPGQPILRNVSYRSPNQRYNLVFQGDGNLVLYDTQQSPWKALWHSKTFGRTTTLCVFQNDGNLVIYNNSQPVWATNTMGVNVRTMSIEDNGQLAIYDIVGRTELWSTSNDRSIVF